MIIVCLKEAVSQERTPVLWGQKIGQVWACACAVTVRCLVEGYPLDSEKCQTRAQEKNEGWKCGFGRCW